MLTEAFCCAGIFKQSAGVRNRVGIGLSYRPSRAGIFKKSMGARHRGGIGFSYRPARLQASGIHSLASIPGPHKHLKVRAQATQPGGIGSLESILGLLKSLKFVL
jgi:hypothetical protein